MSTWRSLVGCSPWGREESDMTEWLHFHFSLSCIGEGNGDPLQCSCLENPRDGGAWRLPSMDSHRVGHDWSDLAAAAAAMIVGWRRRLPVEERGQPLNLLSNFVGNILIWLKRRVHLLHCWWDCKMVQALWRTVWRFLKKVKIELHYGPAIPLLGIYPEKNMIWKNTCIPMSTAALFIITKKQSKCPLTEE